jgi:hypothetical protein
MGRLLHLYVVTNGGLQLDHQAPLCATFHNAFRIGKVDLLNWKLRQRSLGVRTSKNGKQQGPIFRNIPRNCGLIILDNKKMHGEMR